MRVLVTGGAGFIGSHVVDGLRARGDEAVILDNLDPYYDPALKRENLAEVGVGRDPGVRFVEGDLRSHADLDAALEGVHAVVHLAARAGVRSSIADPEPYVDVNLRGTQLLLQAMARHGVRRLVYASSSSVYGAREDGPFRETDPVQSPESPYAATKMAGELLVHAATRTTALQAGCVRLFTVYGPRQRPEMAIHLFARRALAGQPIVRFGDGRSQRDYTYVSDVVAGILAVLDHLATPAAFGFRVYNLGNGAPTTLAELLDTLAAVFGVEIQVQGAPDQPGDVPLTCAAVERAHEELGYATRVPLRAGLERFRTWLQARPTPRT